MKTIHSILASAVILFAAAPLAATAQTAAGFAEETATVEFNPHWFINPQVGAAYTVGETSFSKLISPAAAFYAGYRFSPVFSLRAGVSGWQAKGSWVSPRHNYKWNYVQGNVDAVLSFTNLFMDYNPDRVIDVYGFLGIGGTAGFHNNDVEDLVAAGVPFQKAWSGTKGFIAGRGGLGIEFNVSRAVALTLEVNANLLSDRFNSKKGSKVDVQTNALAGVKINFGRTRKVVQEVVAEEVIEEPAPAPAPAPKPEPKPAPVVKPEPVKMSTDIFFRINSTRIQAAEQEKVDKLITFMKENPKANVTVTGYADKGTGSAAYNMKISKLRAMRIADALTAAGIASSRINIEYKGDTVQPFAENNKNRVVIGVAIAE